MKKFVSMLLCLCMALSLTAFAAAEGYNAGAYEGTGAGRNGDIVVSVTFSDSAIEAVEVVSHSETPGIGDAPIERIPAEIVKYQSLAVDAITGATLTSDGIVAAVADAVVKAGGDAEALRAVAIEQEVSTEQIDKTADVIILGGGGAGMAAAVAAAEKGASVIVVEKTAALGGNTVRSGGYMNAATYTAQNANMTEGQMETVMELATEEPRNEVQAKWQETVLREVEEYKASGATYLFDSPSFHALQTYKGGDYEATPELVESMCLNAPEAFEWLKEMGFDWRDYSVAVIGSLWPRAQMSQTYKSGIGFIEVFTKQIEKENLSVEILYEVQATDLTVTDGRVTGAAGKGADGTTYNFTANKGVILAIGGFSANIEMRQKYNTIWADLGENIPTTNSPAITGDGIVMAEAVGAQLVGMDKIQLLAIADPETGALDAHVGDATSICVNKEGKRYVNETERRDVLAAAALKQTDGVFYIISSTQNDDLDENGYNSYGLHIDDLVAAGEVYRADTLEELAALLGMDPATLTATVDTYNAACDAGEDAAFGKNPEYLDRIGSGPYYAICGAPYCYTTCGALDINEKYQVLAADHETVIEGLYAVGTDSMGVLFSEKKAYVTFGGAANGWAMTSGYECGKILAEELAK